MFSIKAITLFSNGFSSFDRYCLVSKASPKDLDLYFRGADLKEVLKSLSCSVDKGEGKICSVSYQNTKPSNMDNDLSINPRDGFINLLHDLCGASVEVLDVANNEKICGLLVGVEEISKDFKITLLTQGSVLKTFQLFSLNHVRFLDEKVQESIKHSLEKCIASKNKDLLKVTIFTQGNEEYQVKASYSLQQKEWLTSYCLMLDPKDQRKATLVANAILENTQDEDWVSVDLTLVSGSPTISKSGGDSQYNSGSMSLQVKRTNGTSFMINVNPYDTVDTVKQKIENAQSDLAASQTELIFAGKRMDEGRTLNDYGIRNESTIHVKTRSSVSGGEGNSARKPSFRLANPATQSFFKIATPVSVKRGQSALIPLISQPLEATQLLLYNPLIRKGNPLSALMFQNTTGYTLEAGTIVLKQNDITVGEAMLDRMVPKDETVFPYALELGVEVSMNVQLDREKPHRLSIKKGELSLFSYKTQTTSYLFDNKSERAFPLVFVEHSFLDGWDLVEPSTPIDITDSLYRFEFMIPVAEKGSKGVSFIVKEKAIHVESFSLAYLSVEQVQKWSDQKILSNRDLEKKLLSLIDLSKTANSYSSQIYELESDLRACKDSQDRIRKNIQVLAESKQQQAKYVNELGAEEDKLKELYAKIKNLQATKQNMNKHHLEECDKITAEYNITYPKV